MYIYMYITYICMDFGMRDHRVQGLKKACFVHLTGPGVGTRVSGLRCEFWG